MTQQHPTQHPLEGKLEPECRDVQTPLECAALSIAISLKRIADQLDGSATTRGPIGLADTLSALPYFLNRFGGPQS